MVIVVVLPLPQLLVKQVNVVADAILVEQLIELLVINAMRPLDFTVESRRARANVDVSDVLALEVPVELRLKLGAVVRLHHQHAKWQAMQHFIDEPNGCALIARVVHLQDPNPGAIVDGGELIQPAAASGNALEELHIQL